MFRKILFKCVPFGEGAKYIKSPRLDRAGVFHCYLAQQHSFKHSAYAIAIWEHIAPMSSHGQKRKHFVMEERNAHRMRAMAKLSRRHPVLET